MRVNNVLHDQPIKRNGGLNHNRDLTISIGGTGPVAFGHPLRYLLNRLKLHLLRQFKRVSVATHFLIVDLVFSNLILAAYLTRSIAFPAERKSSFSVSKFANWISMGVKMGIDYLGAFFGLLLLMPLFLAIAILIKLDSSGSVFYSQVRVGINRRRGNRRGAECDSSSDRRRRDRRRNNVYGKPFKVYKFRTMIENAEKKCGPIWATENDPRITRVGAFLRKTRMDELPQLFNVLKGEMSLIGPRPERPMFILDLSNKVDNYTKRLDVKPGITGLAQVENGYDSSIDSVKDKVAYDLRYINRWSLWQDIRILLKTVIVVITGKGAF